MRCILPRHIILGCSLLFIPALSLLSKPAANTDDFSKAYETKRAARTTELDQLLAASFQAKGLVFAPNCSDSVFLRRIYLDMIGRLPPANLTRQFLGNKDPHKRAQLIDRLLDSDAYAVYWSMKWSDLLRIKSEFPINLWPNAAQAYHQWIYQSLSDNKPYDQFARELLTSSGSNFRRPEVNFYRAVQGQDASSLARAAALTFMGTRLENWPDQDRANFELFFSRMAFKPTAEWKEEIIHVDPSIYEGLSLTTPDNVALQMPANEDPRELFANWLIQEENPWFTQNVVNRQWAWIMGRGLIHEPDDIRADSTASHPKLLKYLEEALIESDYDMKHVFRLILNSRCYQQSSRPVNQDDAAEHFTSYPVKRMHAEVLSDVLCDLTGTTEEYVSMIPEPFTYIPDNTRTIAIADGSISSAFLQLFGRPARDTGYYTERDSRLTDKQALHLLNSSHISSKIKKSKWMKKLSKGRINKEMLTPIYLAFYSRQPTEAEVKIAKEYREAKGHKPRAVAEDLIWALINSKEFLYNH